MHDDPMEEPRQTDADVFRCRACNAAREYYWPKGRCLFCEEMSPPPSEEDWEVAGWECQAIADEETERYLATMYGEGE